MNRTKNRQSLLNLVRNRWLITSASLLALLGGVGWLNNVKANADTNTVPQPTHSQTNHSAPVHTIIDPHQSTENAEVNRSQPVPHENQRPSRSTYSAKPSISAKPSTKQDRISAVMNRRINLKIGAINQQPSNSQKNDDHHDGDPFKGTSVDNTIYYDYNDHQVGSQTIHGKDGYNYTGSFDVPKGYHLAYQPNIQLFTQGSTENIPVEKGQITSPLVGETVNYMFNGNRIGQPQLIAGSEGTKQTGFNVPTGYHLVNPDSSVTLNRNGAQVNLQISPNSSTARNTVNFDDGENQVSSQVVSGQPGHAYTGPFNVPSGYTLISKPKFTMGPDGDMVDLQVTKLPNNQQNQSPKSSANPSNPQTSQKSSQSGPSSELSSGSQTLSNSSQPTSVNQPQAPQSTSNSAGTNDDSQNNDSQVNQTPDNQSANSGSGNDSNQNQETSGENGDDNQSATSGTDSGSVNGSNGSNGSNNNQSSVNNSANSDPVNNSENSNNKGLTQSNVNHAQTAGVSSNNQNGNGASQLPQTGENSGQTLRLLMALILSVSTSLLIGIDDYRHFKSIN